MFAALLCLQNLLSKSCTISKLKKMKNFYLVNSYKVVNDVIASKLQNKTLNMSKYETYINKMYLFTDFYCLL